MLWVVIIVRCLLHFTLELFLRPQGGPMTSWRHYISQLASKMLENLSKERNIFSML